MVKIRHLILLLVIIRSFGGFAANSSKLDSLIAMSDDCSNDSCKIIYLVKASREAIKTNKDSIGFRYIEDALALANKTEKVNTELKDHVFYFYGRNYFSNGNYPKALDYFLQSLKQAEETTDSASMSRALYMIAAVNMRQNNAPETKRHLNRSLQIALNINDSRRVAQCYYGLGGIYYSSMAPNTDSSSHYLELAKTIHESTNNLSGLLNDHVALGNNAKKQGDYRKAISHYQTTHKLLEKLGRKYGNGRTAGNLASTYSKLGMKDSAFYFMRICDSVGRLENNPQILSEIYDFYHNIYLENDDFANAYYNYKKSVTLEDSIQSAKNITQATALLNQYEEEKRELQRQQLARAKQAEHDAEIKQQRTLVAAAAVIAIAFLIFAIIMWRNYKEKQKANEIILYQKLEVDEKNKEILDSINYAKRIQQAIMPSMDAMHSALENGFVLYLPKDVVAGDFFWMEQIENTVYFAAADCTGHGVPGAMVSVVCSNALTKTLIEEGVRDTGKLLDRTRELVINQLAKSGEEVKDGMDISLCAWDKTLNQLQWSGANNPIWIVRKEAPEIEEIKADKQPIGKYEGNRPFSSHNIQLNEGDSIYIFTDGYQDQFGGPKGKKFKIKQLKKTVIDISNKSMIDQKMILENTFDSWKEDVEQVDDVCVIGVKF